jgi:hypothetical protein
LTVADVIHDPDVSGPLGRCHPRAPHLTLARPSARLPRGGVVPSWTFRAQAVCDGRVLREVESGPGRPKWPQRLLQRVLSHFTHDELPAVGTRICCAVGATSDHLTFLKLLRPP